MLINTTGATNSKFLFKKAYKTSNLLRVRWPSLVHLRFKDVFSAYHHTIKHNKPNIRRHFDCGVTYYSSSNILNTRGKMIDTQLTDYC